MHRDSEEDEEADDGLSPAASGRIPRSYQRSKLAKRPSLPSIETSLDRFIETVGQTPAGGVDASLFDPAQREQKMLALLAELEERTAKAEAHAAELIADNARRSESTRGRVHWAWLLAAFLIGSAGVATIHFAHGSLATATTNNSGVSETASVATPAKSAAPITPTTENAPIITRSTGDTARGATTGASAGPIVPATTKPAPDPTSVQPAAPPDPIKTPADPPKATDAPAPPADSPKQADRKPAGPLRPPAAPKDDGLFNPF